MKIITRTRLWRSVIHFVILPSRVRTQVLRCHVVGKSSALTSGWRKRTRPARSYSTLELLLSIGLAIDSHLPDFLSHCILQWRNEHKSSPSRFLGLFIQLNAKINYYSNFENQIFFEKNCNVPNKSEFLSIFDRHRHTYMYEENFWKAI